MKMLKIGDKIKLKTPLLSGWKGIGTVAEDQLEKDGIVAFTKDDDDLGSRFGLCFAMRHQVSLMRKAVATRPNS